MPVQVHKFDTSNAAGGRQFVAHKVTVDGVLHSMWFSDDGLVDAERRDKSGRNIGIRRNGPRWRQLAARIPALIAQWEKENSR